MPFWPRPLGRIVLVTGLALGATLTLVWKNRAGVSSSSEGAAAMQTGPAATSEPGPYLSREQEDGRLLFVRFCTSCHGSEGTGWGLNAPNLPLPVPDMTDPERMRRYTDADLFDAIASGGAARGQRPVCPSWRLRLDRREIEALVAYVRTLAGREASATDR